MGPALAVPGRIDGASVVSDAHVAFPDLAKANNVNAAIETTLIAWTTTMHWIRIPDEHWGQVWRALVAAGPVSRVSTEPVYVVTDEQLRLLRRKKLRFELLPPANGRAPGQRDG